MDGTFKIMGMHIKSFGNCKEQRTIINLDKITVRTTGKKRKCQKKKKFLFLEKENVNVVYQKGRYSFVKLERLHDHNDAVRNLPDPV